MTAIVNRARCLRVEVLDNGGTAAFRFYGRKREYKKTFHHRERGYPLPPGHALRIEISARWHSRCVSRAHRNWSALYLSIHEPPRNTRQTRLARFEGKRCNYHTPRCREGISCGIAGVATTSPLHRMRAYAQTRARRCQEVLGRDAALRPPPGTSSIL